MMDGVSVFSDKKGIILDKFGLILILFLLSIVLVVMYMVWDGVNDALQEDESIPADDKSAFNEWVTSFPATYDIVFLIIFVGVFLAGVIFLLLVDTAAVFYFFIWMADLGLLYLSAVLANWYARFQSDVSVVDFANEFTIIPFVLSHFLEIMIVVSVVYAVVFFVKTRSSVL